jgi:RNA recognition motif-containing protein
LEVSQVRRSFCCKQVLMSTRFDSKLEMSLDDIISSNRRGERSDRPRDRYPDRASNEPYSRPVNRSAASGTRVYVGNLSYESSWQDLKDHMKQIGDVAYAEVFKEGKKSKGCGIVEFRDKEDARRAIEELNDTMLGNRKIFVREDREQQNNHSGGSDKDRDRRDRDRGGRRDGRQGRERDFSGSGRKIFVGNLNYSTTWQDLKEFFAPCGDIDRVEIASGPDGRSQGRGTILFFSSESARKAISTYHDLMFQGRKLIVHEDKFA